jgi:phosphoglycolate phosphatase
MIKLVLLDFDGTLCATHEAIGHCLVETMRHYGLTQPSGDAIMRTIRSGTGLSETFAALTEEDGTRGVDPHDLVLKYRELYNGGIASSRSHLFPGTRDAIDAIRNLDVAVGVLSNKGEVAVRSALETYELTGLVDVVVCETPGIPKKPDPASYTKLIRPLFPDIESDETLVVGDTVADIQYAANIGAFSCWARYGYGQEEECLGLNPAATIDSISALPALILAWESGNGAACHARRA